MAGVALFLNSTYVAIDESMLNTGPGQLERPQTTLISSRFHGRTKQALNSMHFEVSLILFTQV